MLSCESDFEETNDKNNLRPKEVEDIGFKEVHINITNHENKDLLLFLNSWFPGDFEVISKNDNINVFLKRDFITNKLIFSKEIIDFNDNLLPEDLRVALKNKPVFLNLKKDQRVSIVLKIRNDIINNKRDINWLNYSLIAFEKEEVLNNLNDMIVLHKDTFSKEISSGKFYIDIGELNTIKSEKDIRKLSNLKLFHFEGSIQLNKN